MKTNNKEHKKMSKRGIITIILLIILILVIICCSLIAFYKNSLKPVSKESEEVIVTIDKGMSPYEIGDRLAENKAIRNAMAFKIYVKKNKISGLNYGTYKLNKNMSVQEIIEKIKKTSDYNPEDIKITFNEGKNMKWVAKTIASKTSITEDEVYSKLKDTEYLDKLINKYWFIDDEIKNSDIYYSLEGYLFPDTYYFKKTATVEDIFNTMLDEMENKLEPYKEGIQKSGNTVHQYLTMASIVELEASNKESRAGVAKVFYNRLASGMSLGSDVTTYYGIGIEPHERDLTIKEIMQANAYNTRSESMVGKLPVGPICMCSIESIEAALNPDSNEEGYLYFVADKSGKIYYSKTETEHDKTINELKSSGNWYTYDN